MVFRTTTLAVFVISTVFSSSARADLQFNISATGNANADAGFQRAADLWSAIFDDDITININAGFASLGAGILGSAGSFRQVDSVTDVVAAMAGDATSADDLFASNSVAGLNAIEFRTNNVDTGAAFVENSTDGIQSYESFLSLTRANAKALGLRAGNDAGSDVNITFSSDFAFDFDPSDGITAGQIDFVGVAAHEIGHALGFVSGVDSVDVQRARNTDGNGGNDISQAAFENFALFSTLDLFKYSEQGPGGTVIRDLAFGPHPDLASLPYFSLDGGATAVEFNGVTARFETGRNNGFANRQQASHWRDNLGLGILDPTAAPAGQQMFISGLDIRAIDVIGYDLIQAVPEPSSLGLLTLACTAGLLRRRRRL